MPQPALKAPNSNRVPSSIGKAAASEYTAYLSVKTPLGENKFSLKEMRGQEKISDVFDFALTLTSTDEQIDFHDLVGEEATIILKIEDEHRYFHGVMGEFSQGQSDYEQAIQTTVYYGRIYPKMWLLKFTRDSRIFQNNTALEIIRTILSEYEISDVEDRTQKTGRNPREYCVQYNESAFDFISRLMEEEGIFYFFTHAENRHTLVLCDMSSSLEACPGAEHVQMELSKDAARSFKKISRTRLLERVTPTKHALADYNFETPSTKLYSVVAGSDTFPERRVYEYPGKYGAQSDGEARTGLRLEADTLPGKSLSGLTTVPFFIPGTRFELQHHPRDDMNRAYILFQVDHHGRFLEDAKISSEALPENHVFQTHNNREKFLYSNRFSAFPDETPYRPALKTKKPQIHSTQTAKVTGKEGEEIWTDHYGRIKVKFHWDQSNRNDETSSCWIRVAQNWASNNWGGLFTPRIGQEVVVSFLNGDPDRPLITGCVYNGENLPPYLPDAPTKSTLKSNSSKGGEGFNELRYEDLKGEEQLYMHAQKDMDTEVEDTRTSWIGTGSCNTTIDRGDRNVRLKGEPDPTNGQGDDNLIIERGSRIEELLAQGTEKGNYQTTLSKGDREMTLKNGNETRTLHAGNRSITVLEGNETHKTNGDYTQDVTKNYALTIGGNLVIDVLGTITLTAGALNFKSKTNTTFSSTANTSFKTGTTLSMNAGANAALSAGANINQKAGGSVTTHAGVSISNNASVSVTNKATTISNRCTFLEQKFLLMI